MTSWRRPAFLAALALLPAAARAMAVDAVPAAAPLTGPAFLSAVSAQVALLQQSGTAGLASLRAVALTPDAAAAPSAEQISARTLVALVEGRAAEGLAEAPAARASLARKLGEYNLRSVESLAASLGGTARADPGQVAGALDRFWLDARLPAAPAAPYVLVPDAAGATIPSGPHRLTKSVSGRVVSLPRYAGPNATPDGHGVLIRDPEAAAFDLARVLELFDLRRREKARIRLHPNGFFQLSLSEGQWRDPGL